MGLPTAFDMIQLFETFQRKDFFRFIIGYIKKCLYNEVYIVMFDIREKLTGKYWTQGVNIC